MALQDNLISYWKLDEASGNVADVVNGNTGTNTSVTFSNGKINAGAVFNGTTSKLDVGTPTNLTFNYTDVFSVSCWVKPSVATVTGCIYSKEVNSGVYTGILLYSSAGNVQGYMVNSNAGNQTVGASTTIMTSGNWYHIVWVWGGVANGTGSKIYINGVSETVTLSPATLSASVLTTSPVVIGNRGTGTEAFNGIIDEVGVWKRELTASEVSQLYGDGAGAKYPLFESQKEVFMETKQMQSTMWKSG